MNYEKTIDLREMIKLVKKKFWIICLIIFFSTGASVIYSYYFITPVYETSTNIIIGRLTEKIGDKVTYDDVEMYQKMVKTYCEIAVSRKVLRDTIDRMGLKIDEDEFLKQITVTQKSDTQIMIIKMKGNSPKQTVDTLNVLTENFITEAQKLLPNGSVMVMNSAYMPKSPVSPRPKLNIIIGSCFGMLVSFALILILSYMDKTIKDEKDVEEYLMLPVLGVIVKAGNI